MAEDKSISPKTINPGYNIVQGRGGQGMVMDNTGNTFLFGPNKSGSQNTNIDLNEAISGIFIQSGKPDEIVQTNFSYSSKNFNTVNNQPENIGTKKVIQPQRQQTTTASFEAASEIIAQTSSTTNEREIVLDDQSKTSLDSQSLFLPAVEPGLQNIYANISGSTSGSILYTIKYLPNGISSNIITENGTAIAANGCKTRYPEFEFTDRQKSTLSYKKTKQHLSSKYSSSIAKAVFAIMFAEASKENNSFRSPGGNNYGGVQTDNARWGAPGIFGQFCTRDSGNIVRAFAKFPNNETFLDFMANRIKNKGIDGNNANQWTKTYINKWWSPVLKKEYSQPTNPIYKSKRSIYLTAIRIYNSL